MTTNYYRYVIGNGFNMTNFEKVQAFHMQFGVKGPDVPKMIDLETQAFRLKFLQEELDEFRKALLAYNEDDTTQKHYSHLRTRNVALMKAFDALIDLAYVVYGTADMMGFPMDKGFEFVHRANMQKKRVENAMQSKRSSALDVVKPVGWESPEPMLYSLLFEGK